MIGVDSGKLAQFLELQRQAKRAERAALLSSFSEAEQLLIREAFVAGYLASHIHAGNGEADSPLPRDGEIVDSSLAIVTGYPDLYPTISRYSTPEDDDE
jgi:hypothetical protein